jgi:hypothetical protein
MSQRAQSIEGLDREDRLQQRAGEPQHEQDRGQVADQEVLDHVAVEQLVRDRTQPDQREGDHEQAARERDLPPQRNRPAALGEVRGTQPVQERRDQDRQELEWRELRLKVSLREGHRCGTQSR